MSNKSTKFKVVVIAGSILLILIAIFLATQVIPRAIVIFLEKPKNIKYDDMQKVEIEGDYQGEAYTVDAKGISFDLPYDDEEDDEIYVYDSGLSTEIRKYDYQIFVFRKEGEPLRENIVHEKENRHLYLNTETFNEYLTKVLEYEFDKPSIILPLSELKMEYRIYSTLASYWSDGNYYSLLEEDGFAFAVRISDRQQGEGQFHNLYMSIYDIENGYDFIADISLHKKFMSFNEVSYIVKSIKIQEY